MEAFAFGLVVTLIVVGLTYALTWAVEALARWWNRETH